MTDNDIIKALGVCPHEHLGCEDGCPYIELCNEVNPKSLIKDALDLINRLYAENERLKKSTEGIIKIIDNLCNIQTARAEAITEFAERLTIHFGTYTDKDYLRVIDMVRLIDQIAKEMKGEQ